jgi:uncharacterized membrane protein
MNGIAYTILCRLLIRQAGEGSTLALALGRDWKGKLSVVVYFLAIALAFINPWISFSLYVLVAMMWFIPDRRIERNLPLAGEE